MPLLSPPTLIGIANGSNGSGPKHSISFVYNWVGDVVNSINVGGVNFSGSSYTLDVSALPTSVAKLPPFRTLQLSQTFDSASSDELDGELLISVSGTGQIIRIAQTPYINGTGTPVSITSIVVPIVANAPTKLVFAKGQDYTTAMFGMLTVSIFDFDVPSYTLQGTCNGN